MKSVSPQGSKAQRKRIQLDKIEINREFPRRAHGGVKRICKLLVVGAPGQSCPASLRNLVCMAGRLARDLLRNGYPLLADSAREMTERVCSDLDFNFLRVLSLTPRRFGPSVARAIALICAHRTLHD